MAMAGKSGRSPASEPTTALLHDKPSSEYLISACSFGPGFWSDGVGPLGHASTISSVAPAPVGAPLAMTGALVWSAPFDQSGAVAVVNGEGEQAQEIIRAVKIVTRPPPSRSDRD